jgi:hypothetical protein
VAKDKRFCRHGELVVGFILVHNTPCFVFANKLKRLKLDLKRWNKEVFENVERGRKALMEEI